MNQKTKMGISIITGLLPSWLLGYQAALFIQEITSKTQIVGDRKMLIFIHPTLLLVLAAVISICLLFVWHKIFGPLWDALNNQMKKLKNIHVNKPSLASIKSIISSFFTFGQWKAEKIVQIIFYLGIAAVFFQFMYLIEFAALGLGIKEFASFGINLSYNFPVTSTMFVITLVFTILLELILWKCVCEILLIILRAFEVYFYKTVRPEKLNDYVFSEKQTTRSDEPEKK